MTNITVSLLLNSSFLHLFSWLACDHLWPLYVHSVWGACRICGLVVVGMEQSRKKHLWNHLSYKLRKWGRFSSYCHREIRCAPAKMCNKVFPWVSIRTLLPGFQSRPGLLHFLGDQGSEAKPSFSTISGNLISHGWFLSRNVCPFNWCSSSLPFNCWKVHWPTRLNNLGNQPVHLDLLRVL